MDKNEIWYLADSEAIIVTFKNDTPDVLKISLANLKQNNNLKVVLNYIGCHKFLYQNKKLQTILLEERKIKTEDIIRVQDHYALYKEGNDSYRVLLFDELKNISNEFTLTELPNVNEEAWTFCLQMTFSNMYRKTAILSVISDRTMTILNTGRILDQKRLCYEMQI